MDILNKWERSKLMSRVKSKDTRPEKVVRSLLHRLGLRFRLHRKEMPGKPDVVLPKWKTVILVHGCFWHGCRRCDRGTRTPKSNREFWRAKIAENRKRDARTARALKSAGWRVVVIWGCDTEDTVGLEKILWRAIVQVPTRTGTLPVGQ
ncbi:MAG: DNA mismatch endonuclease Vsr [Gemmataceae bacterium]|nr:DNA mismatch endonuclease Vsr [Gemmataceae bacterium]